jgi:hypothetical protein
MSIYHAKTVTIADDPLVVAAGGVVPSDFNAAHIINIDGTTIHTHSNKSDLDAYNPSNFIGTAASTNFAPVYHNHQAGLERDEITNLFPAITEGTGSFTVASGNVWFFDEEDQDSMTLHTIAASGTLTPTNDVTGYVCADRDTDTWVILNDQTAIDYLRYIPYFVVFKRTGSSNLHTQVIAIPAHGETEAHHRRILACERYARESGYDQISVDGSGNVTSNGGVMWSSNVRYVPGSAEVGSSPVGAITSATRQFFCYHSGGVWAFSSQLGPTLNNTQYDDGTNLQTLSSSQWVINYVYRGVEDQDHSYVVLSNAYNSLEEARAAAVIGALPELITSHAVLIGRIIVLKDSLVDVYVESAFTATFAAATPVTIHNDLSGLQGGATNGYYHVSPQIYSNLTAGSYLTTAAQSIHTHDYQSTGAYLTTAALSNHTHGFTGVNATATFDSNGLSLSIAPGGGGADGYNIIAAGGSTAASTGTIAFNNSNGVSFGLNGSVVTASHNGYTGNTTQFLTTAALSDHTHSQYVNTSASSLLQHTTATSAITSNAFPTANTTNLAVSSVQSRVIGVAGSNASTASGNVQFANGNNVTFGLNGNTITASASFNQTTPTQFAGTTTAGTGVGLTVNSNGINASVVTNYSTGYSAKAESTHGHNFGTTATAGSQLTIGTGSAGVSIGMPAFITTYAAQTADTNKAGIGNVSTVATAGSLMTGSAGTNGITLAVPAYLTVAGGGSNYIVAGSNSTGGTATASGNSVTFGNSNNVSFYVTNGSVVANVTMPPGSGDGWNPIAAGGSTGNSTQSIVFGNANGVSFSLNGSTITASHNGITTGALSDHSHGNPTLALTNLSGTTASASNGFTLSLSAADPGGGAGVTQSRYYPFHGNGPFTTVAQSNGTVFLHHTIPPVNASFSKAESYISIGVGTTTSGTRRCDMTVMMGIYTYNNSTLSLYASGSQTYQVSNTSNATASHAGIRVLSVPISGMFSAGVPYVIAHMVRTSNLTSVTLGPIFATGITAAGAIDFGATSNASIQQWFPGQGCYATSSGSMPQSIRIGTDVLGTVPYRAPWIEFMNQAIG